MTCTICRFGRLAPGTTTVTLDRDGSMVVVRDVPAEVCEDCGEAYLSSDTSSELLRRANEAVERGAEVEILRWVA
jgi:YgiT-type zinc finger domain-containing protein